jgi:hypothetical protein
LTPGAQRNKKDRYYPGILCAWRRYSGQKSRAANIFFAGLATGFCGGGCARICDWLARFLHIF